MLHLAQNIKTVRKLSNLTQFDFAKKFGVKNKQGEFSSDKVYTYETGKAMPPGHLITDIAKYAGVSIDDLKNSVLKRGDISLNENEFAEESVPYQRQSKPLTEAEGIEFLKQHIQTLKENDAWIKKICEELIQTIGANSQKVVSHQETLLRQVAAESYLAARRYAGKDDEKFQEELKNLGILISTGR